jgi:outer membrane receptor protein involved in Fe transport
LLSRELAGGSYSADDDLTAWYGMVDIGLTSWARLVTGARVEDYRLTVRSENQVGQESIVDRAYQDVLPAVALNLDVASDHKLRLSVTRTLARPEYRELAPITYREVLGGEQVIGNKDLERTLIDNYDVRWEWYPGLAEVFSVGLFAKRFQNPIEQRFLARSGTDTRTFENAESATNVGVEVELMKNLAFVASSLEPLSLFANATFMESEVDTGNPDDVSRRPICSMPASRTRARGTASAPPRSTTWSVRGSSTPVPPAATSMTSKRLRGTWSTCRCAFPWRVVRRARSTSRTSWTRRTRSSRAVRPGTSTVRGAASRSVSACNSEEAGTGHFPPSKETHDHEGSYPLAIHCGPRPVGGAARRLQ